MPQHPGLHQNRMEAMDPSTRRGEGAMPRVHWCEAWVEEEIVGVYFSLNGCMGVITEIGLDRCLALNMFEH